ELLNDEGADLRIGRWWNVVMWLVAAQAVVLMVWWLAQAFNRHDIGASLTLLSTSNSGTVLIQWALAIAVFLLLNRWLGRRFESAGE
ncbi:MAG: hypothetical protein Q8W49_03935, partial [Candidatus Palauibacterales bacterium]|nr:hypothetical protein [Candidatus Palauibacterales bacterium]